MGLNIAEKALLKSLEAQEKSGVLDLKPGAKEQLEELREKQLDDQSGLFDRIGLFSTAQASEINPNNPPSMLPTGAMDRETPFGDMLKPEVPRGGSIFSNREFGDITAGASVGQRYNVDNPELFFNTAEGQAPAEDEKNFFDYLQGLSGGVVDFAKDIAGRSFASQALGAGAGMVFGPFGALAGGIFGALKGGDLFKRNPVISDFAQPGNPFGMQTRRDANRFANMLNRLSQGKRIGKSNLTQIMGPTRLNLAGIDVQGMADSIRESSETGYGGFGSAEAAAAEAAASGGRDYSSSPGAMAGDMEYGEE